MKKNHEIRVKLSEEEHKRINKKAELSGMKPSAYLRYLGLNTTIKVTIGD